MDGFKLVSQYKPMGDQPEAIDSLVSGIENGLDEHTQKPIQKKAWTKEYSMLSAVDFFLISKPFQ